MKRKILLVDIYFVVLIKQMNVCHRGYIIQEGEASSIINSCTLKRFILTNYAIFRALCDEISLVYLVALLLQPL